MSQNVPNLKPFEWTDRAETAASLLAEDLLSDEDIATKVNLTRRTLTRWKTHPEFIARVNTYIAEYRERIFSTSIARKEIRVREKDARWKLLRQVIKERAEHSDMVNVPGGKTGLVIRREVPTREGKSVEYSVDTATMRELSHLEKEVAVELGQITKKLEHSGSVAGNVDLSKLSLEQLMQLEAILQEAETPD